jgi:malate dehydrogenase (oxaloacetate-decarboxylating)
MIEDGATPAQAAAALAMVDTGGLVHDGRTDLDADKLAVARPAGGLAADGFRDGYADGSETLTLGETVRALRPTILLGATGTPGTFDEALIGALAERVEFPIVMPLSNPTTATEAIPADILRWSDGRAIVATGSPFPAVQLGEQRTVIGQANNVFVFPGLGLGAIVAEAARMPDELFLVAARTLAGCVTDERLTDGAIYPAVSELRAVTRAIATAVARTVVRMGLAGCRETTDAEVDAAVDRAMWWPAYVPYLVEDEGLAIAD